MRRTIIGSVLVSIILIIASSCRQYGLLADVPVRLVHPDKTVTLVCDTNFNAVFPEVLNAFRLQIVNDTILVFQEQVGDNNIYNFKAYSTVSFNYLGPVIRNGRGPGEMLNPHIANSCSSDDFLNINLNSVGMAYSIDMAETLGTGQTCVAESFTLSTGVVDWLPLSDSGQFVLQIENGRPVFRTIESNGEVSGSYEFLERIADECFITYLSSFLMRSRANGKVAEAMICFPLINIFDVKNKTICSVAVNKDYRKWESVIFSMFGLDTKQYYVEAAASEDNIFALYKGLSIGELSADSTGTHIHVFDWDGNFLYDISVSEDIKNLSYDSRTGFLYAMEKIENKIVRYDLSKFTL